MSGRVCGGAGFGFAVPEFARECVVAVSGGWAIASAPVPSAPSAGRSTFLARARLEIHVMQVTGWCGGVAEVLPEPAARRPCPHW